MAGRASGGSISARAMTRGAGEEGTDWRRKQQLGLVFQVVWRAVANRRWVDSPCRSSGCPRRDVLWRLCVIRGMFRMMRYLGSSRGSHRSRYRGDDGRLNGLKNNFIVWAERSPVFSDFAAPRVGIASITTISDSSGRIFSVSVDPISSFSRASLRCRFTRVGEE